MADKPCFHQLRTVEGLGYVVKLGLFHMVNVIGVGVRVQSPKTSPTILEERVNAWILKFREHLEGW